MVEMKRIQHEIRPSKTALILLDLTHAFIAPGAAFEIPAARSMLPRVRTLADACRAAGVQVVHCSYVHNEKATHMSDAWPLLREGVLDAESQGIAVVDELRSDADLFVEKKTYGAFHRSALEDELRKRDIDTVIIGGCATNYSCYTTAREAQSREFKVVFLSDGTATFDLPDGGFGTISADVVQRSFLTTVSFGCGHVMSVEETIQVLNNAAA